MNINKEFLSDIEISNILSKESHRMNDEINLIPSENIVSKDILMCNSCVFTNKYAEGYPNKRYYHGCEYVDEIENIAIERVKNLFGCQYANVQPHSGSQANQAVYNAILKPNDTVLAMKLSDGGHLTHGAKVNISGSLYNFVSYGVNEDDYLDYDQIYDIAKECKPKLIIAGSSAYPRVIDFKKFKEIADQVNSFLLCDVAHISGLIIAGLHPNPVGYADFITSTTHKTLRGPRGGIILTNNEEYSKIIDKSVFPGIQGGPLIHSIASKAIAFKEASTNDYKNYIEQVVINSKVLADNLLNNGIEIVTKGTDNHLCLIDFRNKDITGNEISDLLYKANIVTNKNMLPRDTRKPIDTSGVRIGTPAVTTRGFIKEDIELLSKAIKLVIIDNNVSEALNIVKDLCIKYPVYKGNILKYGYIN